MSEAARRISCELGDVTTCEVDAIVNAANEGLRGGGGVDGAIHAAAGPGLLAECVERYPQGCPTGEARITGGHGLRAGHVIHTVGPVWGGGGGGEPKLLASCYASCVALAAEEGLRTLAAPAISCGVYGYPHAEAAEVAVGAVGRALEEHPMVEAFSFVLFHDEIYRIFLAALEAPSRPAISKQDHP